MRNAGGRAGSWRGHGNDFSVGGKEKPTGVWFENPELESMISGLETMEREWDRVDPWDCRTNAERFRLDRFRQELFALVDHHRESPRKWRHKPNPGPTLGFSGTGIMVR